MNHPNRDHPHPGRHPGHTPRGRCQIGLARTSQRLAARGPVLVDRDRLVASVMPARWLLPLLAIVVRIGIALATRHVEFDVRVMLAMRRALYEHGFHAYGYVPEWVYPPGFMPWLPIGVWIADHFGLPREFVLRLPSILADAGLTFLVVEALERRGAGKGLVFGAGSLIAFGPMFLAVSSYQGQIDTLAILPAAVAVVLWSRARLRARALLCGSLIGLGAALKTVPGFMVLALLPTARSTGERAVL